MNHIIPINPKTAEPEVSADERLLDKIDDKRRQVISKLLEASAEAQPALRTQEADLAKLRATVADRIKEDNKTLQASRAVESLARRSEGIEAFIQDREVVWLSGSMRYLLQYGGEYKLLTAEAVIHELPSDTVPHDRTSMKMLSETIQSLKRNYMDREYRIGAGRPDHFNMFRSNLCEVAATSDYHPAFDVLMGSLGGGTAENATYLEKWLLCRYNQIEAGVEDPTYPALVFNNHEGGAGKGLLTEFVWPTMFGQEGVLSNASMNDITGNFNSCILNKVFVHINEAAMEKTDSDALKMVLGSPTLMVNTKYMPAFPITNIMAVMISGNDKFSVVKLTGSKIDRRFSVVRTDLDFAVEMKKYVEERTGETVNTDDIAVYIKDVAATVFGSRAEVGKWLNALKARHPNLLHVGPLHGEDYKAAVKVQKPLHERVLDRIFEDPDFRAIDLKMLENAYDTNAAIEGLNPAYKRRRPAFREDCKEAAAKRGLVVARGYDDSRNITFTFHRPDCSPEDFQWSDWATIGPDMKHVSNVRIS